MADPLESVVDLSIDDALSLVRSLGTELEAALVDAASSFQAALESALGSVTSTTPVVVEADTSQVVPEIDTAVADAAPPPVPIDADTEPAVTALAALDSAAAETETALAGISDSGAAEGLDAIASGADNASTALGGLGDSASSTAGGIDAAAGSTQGLSAAQALMEGSVGGAAAALKTGGGSALAAIGPFAALAVATGGLAEEGLKAISAEQRFSAILGSSANAAAVENLQVGDLAANVFELGQKFGSTKAEMQDSIATVYQHADAAGFAAGKARTYADELVAMGARAVALTPSLGNIGDVIDSLEIKFARSRGLVQYGISLSQADINQRALSESGKTVVGDLTVQDKAYAGLALATEKYGSNLSEIVAKGAANAANQQKALTAELRDGIEELAKPLVAPFLEVLRDMIPVGTAAGSAIASLGTVALPALGTVLTVVTPLLQGLAAAVSFLQPVLTPVVAGFVAFEAVTFLPALLTAIGSAVEFLGPALALVGIDGAAAAAGLDAAAEASVGLAGPIGLIAGGFALAAVAGKGLADLFGQAPSDTFPQGIAKVDKALGSLGATANATKVALEFQFATVGRSIEEGVSGATASMETFEKVLKQSPGSAQVLIDKLNEAGVSTKGYQKALDESITSQTKAAQQQLAGTTQLSAQTAALNEAKAALSAKSSQDQATATTTLALAAATGQSADAVRGTASAYTTASSAASSYKTALDILNAGTLSLFDAQNSQISAVEGLRKALVAKQSQDETDVEFENKREQAISSSVHAEQTLEIAMRNGGKTAAEVAGQHKLFVDGLHDILKNAGLSEDAIVSLFQKMGLGAAPAAAAAGSVDAVAAAMYKVPGAADAAASSFGAIPAAADQATADALGIVLDFGTKSAAVLSGAGQQASAGFATGIAPLPGSADQATADALGIVLDFSAPIATAATGAGTGAGAGFDGAITPGMQGGAESGVGAAHEVLSTEASLASASGVIGQAAGSTFGSTFVGGISSWDGLAYAAGQGLVQAAAKGTREGGSPSEHLFVDAAASQAAAYIETITGSFPAAYTTGQQLVQAVVDAAYQAQAAGASQTAIEGRALAERLATSIAAAGLGDFTAAQLLAEAAASTARVAGPATPGTTTPLDILTTPTPAPTVAPPASTGTFDVKPLVDALAADEAAIKANTDGIAAATSAVADVLAALNRPPQRIPIDIALTIDPATGQVRATATSPNATVSVSTVQTTIGAL